ncbi:hypothetical protein MC885_001121 [Smutsia gigantea]|nr:hypothetical protein MC885_001121 [Smutsia gigantea]
MYSQRDRKADGTAGLLQQQNLGCLPDPSEQRALLTAKVVAEVEIQDSCIDQAESGERRSTNHEHKHRRLQTPLNNSLALSRQSFAQRSETASAKPRFRTSGIVPGTKEW